MKNLAHAFRPIANDMASSVLLIILLAFHVDTMTATIVSMAFGAGHIAYMRVRGRTIAPMQWASLGLVLVFGAAGLVFDDIRFLMAKPTVVQLIIAGVMMQRGWMLRYMPPIAQGRGESMMIAWGYVWAAAMATLAIANLVIAIWFTPAWVLYKAIVPVSAMLILFAIQYASIRHSVRRRMIAESAPAQMAPAA